MDYGVVGKKGGVYYVGEGLWIKMATVLYINGHYRGKCCNYAVWYSACLLISVYSARQFSVRSLRVLPEGVIQRIVPEGLS